MRHADLERDAAICKAMADDLHAYLLKDLLYWSLGDSGPRRNRYPQLTLGGLLMRLHHLGVLQHDLSPPAYQNYTYARDQAETTFADWRVRLERKLLVEIKARVRAWSFFLADCAESPGACADEYPTQAEVRTMIELLFGKAEGVRGVGQLYSQVRGVDRRLQNLSTTSAFVWDPVLERAYPRDPFWWLYMRPVGR